MGSASIIVEFVIMVIETVAPLHFFPFEQGNQAHTLHIIRDGGLGQIQKSLCKIQVGYQVVIDAARLDDAWPACQ